MNSIQLRLLVMMFFQFFIWGAWYVTTGNFMASNGMGTSIGTAYSLCPIAAIISPFFLGMIADRFFSSQKILGVLHLIGGVLMLLLPRFTGTPDSPTTGIFLVILLIYAITYMPTLSLSSSVAFAHLQNAQNWFPIIRVGGTIGWIIAGIIVSKALGADTTSMQYTVTGIAALALGVFCFTLPSTPPPAKGQPFSIHDLLCVDAWKLFKDKYFSIFAICSLLVCIPLSAYYAYAQVYVGAVGFEAPAFTMTIGQAAEVIFMLLMPLCFARLGVKWMLGVGMLAWVARYALFAAGATASPILWMVIIGIALHGICYDFFFVTGQIYTDEKSPVKTRSQAQGLYVLLTQGVGMLIGAQIIQMVYNSTLPESGTLALSDWRSFWTIPCILAVVVFVVFMLTFKHKKAAAAENSQS